jgi:uroporphyrinogen-III synthase
VAEAPGVPALAGKTVVVTRAEGQSEELCAELRARGANVKLLPLIAFAPPESFAELDAALNRLESFDWVLFTSANAVQATVRRMRELGIAVPADGKNRKAAAVGPATSRAAEEAGFAVEYVASEHSGAGLAGELKDELRGKTAFLPRSDRANPDLPEALKKAGAKLTEVIAYRTVAPSKADRERVNDGLKEDVDGILFFSPSAVQNFLELVDRKRLEKIQGRAVMVAIGPTTAGALSAAGIPRIAWAADTTTTAVLQALEGHLSRTRLRSSIGSKSG